MIVSGDARSLGPEASRYPAPGAASPVHRGQAADLTLAQIRDILHIRDRGQAPCHHVRELLDTRLADLDQQISQLAELRDTIADLRNRAAEPEPESCSPNQVCKYL